MASFPAPITIRSLLLLSLLSVYHAPSFAEDPWKGRVLDTCPIAANIRTSTTSSIQRFSALSACAEKVVAEPAVPPSEVEGFVRIDGVEAEPLIKRQREENRRQNHSAGYSARAATPFDRDIAQAAAVHRVDPLFLHAVIDTESRYRPTAVSHAGAVGLMQIMPGTGAELGVDREGLFDAGRNIDAGARHLKKLQQRYGGNLELILAAYNAGEGAVARHGNRIPPYRETQSYVRKVMERYMGLRAGSGSVR